MSVQYILSQAGSKMGLDPTIPTDSTVSTGRSVLLRYLNEAARELWEQADVPGCLMEQVFHVNGDQTISLPSTVGTIRAIRELDSQVPWHINQMRPRYNVYNWKDNWRNWRIRNTQALMATVTNQSVGVLSVPRVETPPVVVTVSGNTLDASNVSEVITMDTASKMTVNNFLDYNAVTKNRINTCDVSLKDVDGKLLTVIPNNELEASYQIIDVSACPWLPQSNGTVDNYLEILYKKSLPVFQNDGDEYPAQGYDDVLVNKIMQLWCEEQGKASEALAWDAKATRTMARIKENQNMETEDMVALQPNPHDTLHSRIQPGQRRPYWVWGGGWY